jgi:hypothetical protein
VVTVGYSGEPPGPDAGPENERKYLNEAAGVAREVLDALK